MMTSRDPFPTPTLLSHWPARVLDLSPGRYIVPVPVTRLLSGHDLALTAHIVRGAADGPTLGLLAGIHGDETPGVRCIRDVLTRLVVADLSGAVIAVPVANPLAWQAQQRLTPERDVDHANLARVFNSPPHPTADGGSLSRRLAAALEQTFFAAISHLIDYHCFGEHTAVRLMLYRTGQPEAQLAVSRAMAHIFGLGVVRGVAGSPGTTSAYAAERGIPTCVPEMGGRLGRVADAYFTQLGADGAWRVLRRLDMVQAAPPPVSSQLVVDHVTTLMPQGSGYYLPRFDLEDLAGDEATHGIPVSAGEDLGEVFDPYTLTSTATLTAPHDGYLIAVARGGPFQVGAWSLWLAAGKLVAA